MEAQQPREWRYLLWLAVLLGVFVVVPGMMSVTYLPKSLWAAVFVMLGLAVLPPRRGDSHGLTAFGAVWLAYMGWALLSLAWAEQPWVGLDRWVALSLPALAYLMARRTRFWESRAFWVCVCVINAVVAAIGILQFVFPDSPAFFNQFPGTQIPRTTMGQRNYSAMYFALTAPFLAWAFFAFRGWKSVLAFVAFSLALFFIILSRMRGAWLGCAFGAALAVSAGWPKLRRARLKSLALFGMAVAGLITASLVKQRYVQFFDLGDKTTIGSTLVTLFRDNERLVLWKDAWGTTPLWWGAGFGNYPLVVRPDCKVKMLDYELHNDYLQALVDLGIPGVALFAGAALLLLWAAWRQRREGLGLAAMACVATLALIQVVMFTSQVMDALLWFAGVAAIANRSAPALAGGRLRLPVWARRTGNYAAVIWLVAMAAAIAVSIDCDRKFRRFERDVIDVSNLNRALAAMNQDAKLGLRELEYQMRGFQRDLVRRTRSILDGAAASGRPPIAPLQALARERGERLGPELARLAREIMPRMWFCSHLIHARCRTGADVSAQMGDFDSSELFCRRALFWHPHDADMLLRQIGRAHV